MDPIIKFTEILKNNIGQRKSKGEKLSSDELEILDDNDIFLDNKAVDSFAAMLYAVSEWCKQCNTEKFISLIIDKYYVPVMTSEVIEYKEIMTSLNIPEDTWDGLFLTICGVWLKICEDLTLDPDFTHVKYLKVVKDANYKLKDDSYIAYTSAIVTYSYLVGQNFYEEQLPQLYDPSKANLMDDDYDMMLPFILITLALLTAEFTKLNVINHDLVNQWCEETGLTPESQHADVMNAAKMFFAPRIKQRLKE